MILRYDRLGIEIPPGDPDPGGAMAVQELMWSARRSAAC